MLRRFIWIFFFFAPQQGKTPATIILNSPVDDVSTITEITMQASERSEERVADCEEGMMQRIEMWLPGPRCHGCCMFFESREKYVCFFSSPGTNLCRLYVYFWVVNCPTMTKKCWLVLQACRDPMDERLHILTRLVSVELAAVLNTVMKAFL